MSKKFTSEPPEMYHNSAHAPCIDNIRFVLSMLYDIIENNSYKSQRKIQNDITETGQYYVGIYKIKKNCKQK